MSLTQFIPSVWAASILENLRKSLVYAQQGVTNKDYEGEIREFGDKVHIHSLGAITIGDYVRDVTEVNAELLTDSRQTLEIDRAKYFAFKIDDLDTIQQKPKAMAAATRQAVYQLSDVADQFVASHITDAGHTQDDGAGGSVVLTAANAYGQLVQAGVTLDEANIPAEGRYAIIPPWLAGEILMDKDYTLEADPAATLNGSIGRLAGFSLLKSNNVPVTAGEYSVQVGHPMAITYAQQIIKTEAYRPEKSFADALKGLHVYGAKVTRPDALLVIRATRG